MSTYDEIYRWVCHVPEGKVASYGQIAGLVGKCSARQVGYAMAALADDSGVPWHRIINSQGRISMRAGSEGHRLQRILLEAEGIVFSADDRIDLVEYRWTAAAGDANPKDTKDYPEGVWTLPPTYRLGETDKAKYTAIGESDRMTMKFVKL